MIDRLIVMRQKISVRHVFIIGCKGIPARYGGFETFVDKLTEYSKNERRVKYHVACAVDHSDFDHGDRHYEYSGAHCFKVKWRNNGSSKAIFYDLDALDYSIRFAKRHNIKKPIFYILACRIGPFISKYKKQIKDIGGLLYVNPDGDALIISRKPLGLKVA